MEISNTPFVFLNSLTFKSYEYPNLNLLKSTFPTILNEVNLCDLPVTSVGATTPKTPRLKSLYFTVHNRLKDILGV